jgi:hypothetical protein
VASYDLTPGAAVAVHTRWRPGWTQLPDDASFALVNVTEDEARASRYAGVMTTRIRPFPGVVFGIFISSATGRLYAQAIPAQDSGHLQRGDALVTLNDERFRIGFTRGTDTPPTAEGDEIMADETNVTQTVEASEKPKKERKAKAPKAPKVELPKANGVTRPKAGTQTGRIWDISDALSAEEGKPASRKDVLAAALAESINEATAATQYGKWRKFHGLKKEEKAVEASAPSAS